jgi:type I restriction enzyme S subunit
VRKLPAGWSLVPLDTLGGLERPAVKAGPFGSALKKEFYVRSGYRVYGQEQVIADDFSIGDYFIDATRFHTLRACEVRAGDVLVSLVGTFGKAAIVPNDALPGIINPRLIRLSLDPRLINPSFIKLYLESPGVQSYFESMAHGGTMGVLNATTISPLPVRLPPLAEQSRIVAKLDALFARSRAAKTSLERVPALLERLRQAILAAAFCGDLSSRWRETAPLSAQSLPELGEVPNANSHPKKEREVPWAERTLVLPSTWGAAKLSSLVDPERGIPYGIVQTGNPTPGGVPTVRCGDVKGFKIQRSTLKLVAPEVAAASERTTLKGGEVLIAIRGTVGQVALADEELAGCNISREVALVPVAAPMLAKFIMYYLASPQAQQFIAADVKGVAQSGINLADLRELPVPVASVDEQREVVRQVEVWLGVIHRLQERVEAQSHRLGLLEQASLAAAFRGELVPQDPNDEPASVLLERIRAERESTQPVKRKRGTSPSAPTRARSSKAAP